MDRPFSFDQQWCINSGARVLSRLMADERVPVDAGHSQFT